jgi:hypothetical protein
MFHKLHVALHAKVRVQRIMLLAGSPKHKLDYKGRAMRPMRLEHTSGLLYVFLKIIDFAALPMTTSIRPTCNN